MIKWRYRDQIKFSKSSQLVSGGNRIQTQVVQPQSCALSHHTESCYTRIPVDHSERIDVIIGRGPIGLGKNPLMDFPAILLLQCHAQC